MALMVVMVLVVLVVVMVVMLMVLVAHRHLGDRMDEHHDRPGGRETEDPDLCVRDRKPREEQPQEEILGADAKPEQAGLQLDEPLAGMIFSGIFERFPKLKVVSVLESLPGVGKVRARKIMEKLDISATRRVRGLGAKQRDALVAEFQK